MIAARARGLAGSGLAEDDVVIRTATGDDLDGVLAVGHRTWPVTFEPIAGPEYVAMGLAKWWTADAVTPSIRVGRTLVAVDGDEVVGVATYGLQDDELVNWKLYVLPTHHHRGIGTKLLDAVVDRARELGHDRVVLSHLEGNDDAASFYARRGFVETHRESGGSVLPDSIWMAKDLTGPADASGRGVREEDQ
ncbi:GCN5 family acetyltransferase [Intrasporangium oryzae NRRL B-24470]|uniref:GCN5 family acetyltransferase n=1 Tax=Intrasporangium oryzae NRRL B-24470 TaxID=1386089 RepID=W9G279_9MICO|nr:GNAT family N-acetyltransferase [Intrasporangium oryzae]EWT00080.1 GCN5 family acetyltransferase [Intrasporangium oryzae NRRL B-24470]